MHLEAMEGEADLRKIITVVLLLVLPRGAREEVPASVRLTSFAMMRWRGRRSIRGDRRSTTMSPLSHTTITIIITATTTSITRSTEILCSGWRMGWRSGILWVLRPGLESVLSFFCLQKSFLLSIWL